MPVALPYRFDTSSVVKLILRGVLGLLLLVIVPGIAYSVLVSHREAVAIHLLLVGLITVYFGRIFVRNLEASRGVITTDTVEVDPGTLYGLRLHGPAGRFPLQSFTAVRVDRVPPPAFVQGGPHERVSLAGKEGTPDILIARTSHEHGRALGRDLASALGLQYQEQSVPY